MDKNISRVFRPIEGMKYSTKGKTCLFHFRRFRFENVVAKARRVQKVLEWMESSSEVTQLRIRGTEWQSWKVHAREILYPLFFSFSSFCRYSFDPKLNFPFFWSVQDDIFENFPQKFRAQFSNGFIVSCRKKRRATFKFFGVLSNVVGSKMISRN